MAMTNGFERTCAGNLELDLAESRKLIQFVADGAAAARSGSTCGSWPSRCRSALAAHARALGGADGAAVAGCRSLPLAALAAGAWLERGTAQAWALLVAFPVLVAVPEALAAAERDGAGVPGAASLLAAASLVAFLVSVARAQVRERAGGLQRTAGATRRLHQDPVPSRWRRRLRVYRGLAVRGARLPARARRRRRAVAVVRRVAGGVVRRARGARAGARSPSVWACCGSCFCAPISWRRCTATCSTIAICCARWSAIGATRDAGGRGAAFYFAVAVALVAMVAVVWQRAR